MQLIHDDLFDVDKKVKIRLFWVILSRKWIPSCRGTVRNEIEKKITTKFESAKFN